MAREGRPFGWLYRYRFTEYKSVRAHNKNNLDTPLIPITPTTLPRLYAVLQIVAKRVGIPTPMMFVDPQGYANAHAFGWLQRWGFASITTGQLKENSDGETLAVMAHEFGHLKHRDTLRNDFTTPLSVITGLIPAGIMAAMTFRSLKRNRRINPAQYIGFRIGAGASLVLWPVIFYLMQKYFSRRRERFADRVSAQHFDPRYGKRFFEKILKKCGRDKRFLAWLRRTHPFKEERIKFFESQIPVWDARQEKEKAAAAAAA